MSRWSARANAARTAGKLSCGPHRSASTMKGTAALNAERSLEARCHEVLVAHGENDPLVVQAQRTTDHMVEVLFSIAGLLKREARTAWIADDGEVIVVSGFVA